jgi:hypothetical protein
VLRVTEGTAQMRCPACAVVNRRWASPKRPLQATKAASISGLAPRGVYRCGSDVAENPTQLRLELQGAVLVAALGVRELVQQGACVLMHRGQLASADDDPPRGVLPRAEHHVTVFGQAHRLGHEHLLNPSGAKAAPDEAEERCCPVEDLPLGRCEFISRDEYVREAVVPLLAVAAEIDQRLT